MFKGESVNEQQEAVLVLHEMSTVLMCLASEIDGALSSDGKVDPERLGKIAQALRSSHDTLKSLSDSSAASPSQFWQIPPPEIP